MPSTPAYHAQALRSSFDHLLYTLAQLEPNEVQTSSLDNGWTPIALIAHVAFWDEAQRLRMEAALRGDVYTRPVVGENDDRARAEARPLAEVLAEAEAARAALIAFAEALSADALERDYPEGERMLSLEKVLAHMVNHTRQHEAELFAYAASMRRWGRAGIRNLLDVQHSVLMDSIAGLAEETILTTHVAGGWTLREQLVHVLAWSEYTYCVVAAWPAVDPATIAEWCTAPGEDEDAVNARLLANRADMNMIAIVDMLSTWHRRVLTRIDALGNDALASVGDDGFGSQSELCRFLYSMCLHQAEHALEIWEVRA